MDSKVLIISAPSGSGKTTLVKYLMENQKELNSDFVFSISATTRAPRGEEKNGVDYHFLTIEDFKKRVENDEFIEWEEVYKDVCYGTLKSEVDKAKANKQILIFDVDVVGGVNLKKIFGKQALSVFVQAPSIDSLRSRLISRSTDNMETIEKRISKAEFEMTFKNNFDEIVVNDQLNIAQKDFFKKVEKFIIN
jgi:guanylate kinase